MNDRCLAISILQKARDTLSERLTRRIVESQQEIEDDAEGCSYLSEIETIYEQLGGRLAHLNAMLTNLPPASAAAPADSAASEIIYADLASAYPTGLDLESASPVGLLALPAPPAPQLPALADPRADSLQDIVMRVQAGDLLSASRSISELFDIRPSEARRCAQAFSRQIGQDPDLVCRLGELGSELDAMNEQAAAELFAECFEFPASDALVIARTLKSRLMDSDTAPLN